nr:replication-associated recombination protein A [Bacteroidia bacterium]
HDFPGNFAAQEYLPDELKGTVFYEPGKNERENSIKSWLHRNWKGKYRY